MTIIRKGKVCVATAELNALLDPLITVKADRLLQANIIPHDRERNACYWSIDEDVPKIIKLLRDKLNEVEKGL